MLPLLACLALALAACRRESPTSPVIPPPPPPPPTEIFVDASNGDDASGLGTSASPYRTIGRGLERSEAGMTVTVRAGTYDLALGESFPLRLKADVSLVGVGAEQVIVNGGGADVVLEDASRSRVDKLTIRGGQQAALVLRNASTLSSCIVENNRGGVLCQSDATISSNIIQDNSDFGLAVRGSSSALVDGNTVRSNGGDGVLCEDTSSPTLRGNTVRENGRHGVVCTDGSVPLLEGNTIAVNVLPEVYILYDARPTIRGNIIRGNERYNIDDARSPNRGQLSALGNTWDAPQPSGTVFGPADSRPNYFIKEAGNSIKFSE